jgi:hypothetical protein
MLKVGMERRRMERGPNSTEKLKVRKDGVRMDVISKILSEEGWSE